MNKAHGGKHAPKLPENGLWANGKDMICEKFRSVYSQLYNSASSEEEINVINARVESNIVRNDSVEMRKITEDEEGVKLAAVTTKKNKGDVPQIYTSSAIRNDPDVFYEHLASAFRSWLYQGTVTTSLLNCAFMPLLKNSLKNPAETKSYQSSYSWVFPLFETV